MLVAGTSVEGCVTSSAFVGDWSPLSEGRFECLGGHARAYLSPH